jgi:hypothetical protein
VNRTEADCVISVVNRMAGILTAVSGALLPMLLVALGALAVVGALAAGSPRVGATNARPQTPAVARSATPPGWIPVDFDDAQLSIPASWTVITGDEEVCGSGATGVLILGPGTWCTTAAAGPTASATSVVTVASSRTRSMASEAPALRVNGLSVYAPGLAPVYFVPALRIELTFSGPLQPRVLHSLTYSPRAVALAGHASASVPKDWRWVSFKAVRLAVPRSWRVNRTANAPACGTETRLSLPGVTLASHPALPLACPAPPLIAEPPVAGVEVDGFSYPKGGGSSSPSCSLPRRISSLKVCVQAQPAEGVLVVQVSGARTPTATVKIGMFGNGITGRTVLDSLRRS